MSASNMFLIRYLQKLGWLGTIFPEAEQAFARLAGQSESFRKAYTIVHEGEPTPRFHLITKGSAYSYKTLRSGERQILSFHMANEVVDFRPSPDEPSDFGVRACEPLEVVSISAAGVMALTAQHADIAQALWLNALAQAAITREWMANCGRRSTRNSIVHLLLEFAYRSRSLNSGDEWKFQLPFTQSEIADAVGSSPVQVNRTMQALRGEHLIRTYGSTIVIEAYETLAREADFNPTYLGLPPLHDKNSVSAFSSAQPE